MFNRKFKYIDNSSDKIRIISYNILLRFIDEICEDVRRIDILLSKRILNHNEYESYIKKLFLFYRRLNYDVLN